MSKGTIVRVSTCAECQEAIESPKDAKKCKECHKLVHTSCVDPIDPYCWNCISGGNDVNVGH